MKSVKINNMTITKDEVIEMIETAVIKVDNSKYRFGHRVEDIWGYFWVLVENKVNDKVSFSEITKLKNMINVNEIIFR